MRTATSFVEVFHKAFTVQLEAIMEAITDIHSCTFLTGKLNKSSRQHSQVEKRWMGINSAYAMGSRTP